MKVKIGLEHSLIRRTTAPTTMPAIGPGPSLHEQLTETPGYDAEPAESHELQATFEQVRLAEMPKEETDKEHAQPPDESPEQLSEFELEGNPPPGDPTVVHAAEESEP